MQITLETDYAIRTLLFLSGKTEYCSAREIGEAIALKWEHAQKILRKLHKQNLVKATYGRDGGYLLAKEPKDITMLDVMKIMENKHVINRCLEDDRFCSRPDVTDCRDCPVHRFYDHVQGELEDVFRNTTIQDFVDCSDDHSLIPGYTDLSSPDDKKIGSGKTLSE